VRLRRDVTLPRRGVYECGPLRATSSYPFGLVQQEVSCGTPDRLVVLPRLGALNVGRLRRWLQHTARPDERNRRSRRKLAQEVEFHSLRSFRPGDSPRWIHWRTSARRNELMVREFDQGTHYDLVLLVDASVPERGPHFVEEAVSLAATIVWAWTHESGDRVVLGVAGASPAVVAGHGGPKQGEQLLECLAGVVGTVKPDLMT